MKNICAPGDWIPSKLIFFWHKHFHPHLNLSVCLLSASSLSMCVAWIDVHMMLCVFVCVLVNDGVRGWHAVYTLCLHELSLHCILLASRCLFCPPHVYSIFPLLGLPSPLPVVNQASTLSASSNNDPDMNRGEGGNRIRCTDEARKWEPPPTQSQLSSQTSGSKTFRTASENRDMSLRWPL